MKNLDNFINGNFDLQEKKQRSLLTTKEVKLLSYFKDIPAGKGLMATKTEFKSLINKKIVFLNFSGQSVSLTKYGEQIFKMYFE